MSIIPSISKAICELLGIQNGQQLPVHDLNKLFRSRSRPFVPRRGVELEIPCRPLAEALWTRWALNLDPEDWATVSWTEAGEVTISSKGHPIGPLVLTTNLDYDSLWLVAKPEITPTKQRLNRTILMNTILRGECYLLESEVRERIKAYFAAHLPRNGQDVYVQHSGSFFIVHALGADYPLVFLVYEGPGTRRVVSTKVLGTVAASEFAAKPQTLRNLDGVIEAATARGEAMQDNDKRISYSLGEGSCTSWMGFNYGVEAGIHAFLEQLQEEGFRITHPNGNELIIPTPETPLSE